MKGKDKILRVTREIKRPYIKKHRSYYLIESCIISWLEPVPVSFFVLLFSCVFYLNRHGLHCVLNSYL